MVAMTERVGKKQKPLKLERVDIGMEARGNGATLTGDVSVVISGAPDALSATMERLEGNPGFTVALRERTADGAFERSELHRLQEEYGLNHGAPVNDLVITRAQAYERATNGDRDRFNRTHDQALGIGAELLAQVRQQLEFDMGATVAPRTMTDGVTPPKEGGVEITTRFDNPGRERDEVSNAAVLMVLRDDIERGGRLTGHLEHMGMLQSVTVRIPEEQQGEATNALASERLATELARTLRIGGKQR